MSVSLCPLHPTRFASSASLTTDAYCANAVDENSRPPSDANDDHGRMEPGSQPVLPPPRPGEIATVAVGGKRIEVVASRIVLFMRAPAMRKTARRIAADAGCRLLEPSSGDDRVLYYLECAAPSAKKLSAQTRLRRTAGVIERIRVGPWAAHLNAATFFPLPSADARRTIPAR